MFAFNDAWLINESLALHVSTNTFTNPAFDQDHIDYYDEDDKHDCRGRKESSSSSPKNLETQKKKDERTSFGKSSFADTLAFSIRSKLFVIDLNLKRKLRGLKAFATRHFPNIFQQSHNHIQQQKGITTTTTSGEGDTAKRRGSFVSRNLFLQSRRRDKIYDSSDDHFWSNIVEQPNSRKSLGKQKEKILHRLEQALEQKRNQHDLYNYQEKQQGSPVEQKQSWPDDGGSERTHRPGIGGHRVCYSDSFSSSSSSRSSQSSSSSSSSSSPAVAASSHSSQLLQLFGGGVAGEAIMIGSQNWAKRHCQTSTKTNRKSGGRRQWKQIRDVVTSNDASQDESFVSEGTNSKKLCIVCYTNTPNIVTLPCKHHDVCSDCFIEMIYIAVKKSQYPLKCALCRQKVEKIRCSRKLLLSVIEKQRIYP